MLRFALFDLRRRSGSAVVLDAMEVSHVVERPMRSARNRSGQTTIKRDAQVAVIVMRNGDRFLVDDAGHTVADIIENERRFIAAERHGAH